MVHYSLIIDSLALRGQTPIGTKVPDPISFWDQVQYLKVLSVRILANISPSGRAMMIMMAAANQDTASESDMIPKLYIARYR